MDSLRVRRPEAVSFGYALAHPGSLGLLRICRFLPACYPAHAVVKLEELAITHPWLTGKVPEGASKAAEKRESTRRLELAGWQSAFDRFV